MKEPVLIIGNFLSQAGGSRGVCEELALRLKVNGRRVLTASHHRARLLRLLDMLVAIVRHRHAFTVAQVDVYSGPAFLWAEATCATLRALGKPFVQTLHGGNLPTFAAQNERRVEKLLRSAAVVTSPSTYLCQQMADYRPDLHFLPNALDVSRYPFHLRHKPQPNLVWLRAFHEIYNPALAVRVCADVLRSFPRACLTMIGPDKGDGSLEETRRVAEHLGIRHHLHLPGQVAKEEVPAWLSRGDIFLNTTNVDNAPVSVLEAMATGLCVVTTDVGGLPYLLDHGQDALLVRPKDAEAMAAATRSVLQESKLAACLSRSARTKAEGRDWSVILPQWETLLDQVACKSPFRVPATRWQALYPSRN